MKITQEEGVTVLMTTHYIDETKDANKVSFDVINLFKLEKNCILVTKIR
jgi:ABC-type multidrug transport system ATPase subunit